MARLCPQCKKPLTHAGTRRDNGKTLIVWRCHPCGLHGLIRDMKKQMCEAHEAHEAQSDHPSCCPICDETLEPLGEMTASNGQRLKTYKCTTCKMAGPYRRFVKLAQTGAGRTGHEPKQHKPSARRPKHKPQPKRTVTERLDKLFPSRRRQYVLWLDTQTPKTWADKFLEDFNSTDWL